MELNVMGTWNLGKGLVFADKVSAAQGALFVTAFDCSQTRLPVLGTPVPQYYQDCSVDTVNNEAVGTNLVLENFQSFSNQYERHSPS